MEVYYLSMKGPQNESVIALFDKARKLDADGLSNAEVWERAENYTELNKDKIDFKYYIGIGKQKVNYSGNIPQSFKVKVNNSELDKRIDLILKEKFEITTIKTPFKAKMILLPYIDYMNNQAMLKSKETESIDKIKLIIIDIILKKNSLTELEKILKDLR